jgi:hypothetical protein
MSDLYFACDWIISSDIIFSRAYRAAEKLAVEVVTIGGNKTNDEGFLFITFAVCVSDEAQLEEFNQMLSLEYGLVDWYPITEATFSQGDHFLETFRHGLSSEQTSLIDSMSGNMARNNNQREKLDHANEESLYFGCDWAFLPEQLLLLPKAIEAINQLGGGIHALWSRDDDNGYHIQELGVRVASAADLASFNIDIGQAIGWSNWRRLSVEHYYWGTNFTVNEYDRWDIGLFIETHQETALKNQQIAKNQNP